MRKNPHNTASSHWRDALYLPAPRLRQAGGLTPEEIKIVEESAQK